MALVLGPLMLGFGLALATNYRGWTESHVRTTFRIMGPINRVMARVQPWKRWLRRPAEMRVRTQIRRERWMGATFAAGGLLVIVAGVFSIVSWLAA
jgi:hypothetical protein